MPTVANICPISCNTEMENCNGGDTVELVLFKRYRFRATDVWNFYIKPKENIKELFGSPVKVYDSLAAQWSAFQGHHSPLTCSSILPASPGFDPEGSTVLHWPLKQKGFIFKTYSEGVFPLSLKDRFTFYSLSVLRQRRCLKTILTCPWVHWKTYWLL